MHLALAGQKGPLVRNGSHIADFLQRASETSEIQKVAASKPYSNSWSRERSFVLPLVPPAGPFCACPFQKSPIITWGLESILGPLFSKIVNQDPI